MERLTPAIAAARKDMTERLQRDIAFMQEPGKWPRWPLLPLRLRSGGDMMDEKFCAFQFADGRPVIYFGVIYMIPSGGDHPVTWGQKLSSFKSKEYASFEDLAAEYMVD